MPRPKGTLLRGCAEQRTEALVVRRGRARAAAAARDHPTRLAQVGLGLDDALRALVAEDAGSPLVAGDAPGLRRFAD